MVKRDARVTWAVTHLVRVQDYGEGESLFGTGNDWQSGEVSPELGQLSYDQAIIVDDEEVFMSRRGANQEDASRRQQDEGGGELKHKWYKVLAVVSDGELKEVPDDTYVRAETLKLGDVEMPPRKTIEIAEQNNVDTVSTELEGFYQAWMKAGRRRRRSIGQVKDVPEDSWDITSGWNWDQYDEGENVSGDMREPGERAPFKGNEYDPTSVEAQSILRANYTNEEGPGAIAYMVLEVRNDGAERYWYIRWLIAHPESGGGGSALVKEVIRRFNEQEDCEELRVESAFSAVGWYEKMGFKKVHPDADPVVKGVGYKDTELVYRKGS